MKATRRFFRTSCKSCGSAFAESKKSMGPSVYKQFSELF